MKIINSALKNIIYCILIYSINVAAQPYKFESPSDIILDNKSVKINPFKIDKSDYFKELKITENCPHDFQLQATFDKIILLPNEIREVTWTASRPAATQPSELCKNALNKNIALQIIQPNSIFGLINFSAFNGVAAPFTGLGQNTSSMIKEKIWLRPGAPAVEIIPISTTTSSAQMSIGGLPSTWLMSGDLILSNPSNSSAQLIDSNLKNNSVYFKFKPINDCEVDLAVTSLSSSVEPQGNMLLQADIENLSAKCTAPSYRVKISGLSSQAKIQSVYCVSSSPTLSGVQKSIANCTPFQYPGSWDDLYISMPLQASSKHIIRVTYNAKGATIIQPKVEVLTTFEQKDIDLKNNTKSYLSPIALTQIPRPDADLSISINGSTTYTAGKPIYATLLTKNLSSTPLTYFGVMSLITINGTEGSLSATLVCQQPLKPGVVCSNYNPSVNLGAIFIPPGEEVKHSLVVETSAHYLVDNIKITAAVTTPTYGSGSNGVPPADPNLSNNSTTLKITRIK